MTSKQIQDQQLFSVDKVLQQTTGVSQQIWGSSHAGYNYLYARGNQISNISLDGTPIGKALADVGNQNSLIYDRVEVTRGVNGLLDGSGEPSASVNLVRKRPSHTARQSVAASIGNRQQFALTADVSGSLNHDHTLAGRLIMSVDGKHSVRQRERENNQLAYGILEYTPNTSTRIDTGFSWQRSKQTAAASHSFAAYDNQGYATVLTPKSNPAPNWAYSQSDSLNLFLNATQQFNDDWKGQLSYNYLRGQWQHPYGVAGVLSIDHDNHSTDMITGYWQDKPESHSLKLSLQGNYTLFNHQHQFFAGINGYRTSSNRHGARNLGNISNVYDDTEIANYPQPSQYRQIIPGGSKNQQIGGYLGTQLNLDHLHLIVGSRYSMHRSDSYNRATQGMIRVSNHHLTPYIGINYDISDNLSAYASYSSLFIPQNQKDINGVQLNPITGRNTEIGLKGSWNQDKLNASLSLFDTRKNNMAVRAGIDSNGDTYYRAADYTQAQGAELNISDSPLPAWQIHAGYSYTQVRNQNHQRVNSDSVPKHAFKLYSSYDFNYGQPQGLTIGGGLRWQSETHADNLLSLPRNADANTRARAAANSQQPAYAVVDVMANYRINDHAQLGLNIDNLFNKHYRTMPERHSYGELRNIRATFRYQF